jgi:IS30 family transposase
MAHKYQQLNIEEREVIQKGLWEGKSMRCMAKEMGRSPGTISRELKRNCPLQRRLYLPRVADKKAYDRIVTRGQRPRLKNAFIRTYVKNNLKEGLSPEQIVGRLSLEFCIYRISHEAIYQYIYTQYHRGGYGTCTGLDLRRFLRRRHKVRHPKKIPHVVEQGALRERISIDERPSEVEDRSIPGHWEGDSIVSRKSTVRLNTLVERTSGVVCISKLKDGSGQTTTQAVIRRLGRVPKRLRKTLTVDNGFENAGHRGIKQVLDTDVYFAHPYHSWERGTNENTNGLIRWYLPKGTDFATIPEEVVDEIEYRLNTRPRKRLGWQTPLEVFNSFVLH